MVVMSRRFASWVLSGSEASAVHAAQVLVVAAGLVMLTAGVAMANHLPPVDPILPGSDHQHENHDFHNHFGGADFSSANFAFQAFGSE